MPAVVIVTMPQQPIMPLVIPVGSDEHRLAICQIGSEDNLAGIIQPPRVQIIRRKAYYGGTEEFIARGKDLVRRRGPSAGAVRGR